MSNLPEILFSTIHLLINPDHNNPNRMLTQSLCADHFKNKTDLIRFSLLPQHNIVFNIFKSLLFLRVLSRLILRCLFSLEWRCVTCLLDPISTSFFKKHFMDSLSVSFYTLWISLSGRAFSLVLIKQQWWGPFWRSILVLLITTHSYPTHHFKKKN